jgi:hypothetical protein
MDKVQEIGFLISAYEIRLQYLHSRAQSTRDVIEGNIRLLKNKDIYSCHVDGQFPATIAGLCS